MIRRKRGVEEERNWQLKRASLLTLVVSLALVGAQPATAKGKPPFPAASHLCEMQGGVFSAYDGFGYSCSGMSPEGKLAGMHAITPLCERAASGRYITAGGNYLCML